MNLMQATSILCKYIKQKKKGPKTINFINQKELDKAIYFAAKYMAESLDNSASVHFKKAMSAVMGANDDK